MKRKCSKIPFNKKFHVYVVKNDRENIEWISLYDLCRLLKRQKMYEIGEAARRCPSCRSFPVYGNGKLFQFACIRDVYSLLRSVKGESRQIAPICDEIEKWVASLPQETHTVPELSPAVVHTPVKPVTFIFHDQPVSFMTANGKTFFNATQMARGFGKNPREWLMLAGTNRFRQSLVNQGKSESMDSQMMTVRGSTGATWIEDSLGMEFSRWLSPEFSQWCNERVKELVTCGYVTLKDSGVDRFSAGSGRFPVPANFRDALLLAAAQQEEIERQQQQIEEDRPKVVFYNDFIENRESFKSSIIAEELHINALQLNRFLIEEKICKYEKKQYIVYPAYAPLQCDFPYYWTNKHGKTYACSHGKRWTQAGREYILELYRKKNPYPHQNPVNTTQTVIANIPQ